MSEEGCVGLERSRQRMGMTAPVLLVAVSVVVWCAVYRSLVAHPLDPIALTLYYLALQVLWRPLTLVVGLDTPFPTELFAGREVGTLVLAGQAVVIVWLVALWAGARLLAPLATPATVLFPRSRTSLGPRTLLLVAAALTAVALVVSVGLWGRYGGPTGLIEASKVGRDVVESRALRSVPLVAALFGIAAFFTCRPGARLARLAALGLVVVAGALSFTWGARDVPVLSVVALIGGSLLFGEVGQVEGRGVSRWFHDPRWRRRFALVALVSLGLAFSLRAVRDTLLWEGLAPTIEGEPAVRQLAVATNNTFYDTLLLILDDWPDRYDHHGWSDFVDGAVASVPTAVAGDQEPFTSPAVQVAQTYLDRNNGFPATALGDWYLGLGVAGVALGGLLSGLLARAGQVALSRFTSDPLVWAISTVFLIRIFPGGLWVTSLPKWVAIGLPIIVVTAVLNRLLGASAEEPAAVPAVLAAPVPVRSGTASPAAHR
jgi:hypothetical protein